MFRRLSRPCFTEDGSTVTGWWYISHVWPSSSMLVATSHIWTTPQYAKSINPEVSHTQYSGDQDYILVCRIQVLDRYFLLKVAQTWYSELSRVVCSPTGARNKLQRKLMFWCEFHKVVSYITNIQEASCWFQFEQHRRREIMRVNIIMQPFSCKRCTFWAG